MFFSGAKFKSWFEKPLLATLIGIVATAALASSAAAQLPRDSLLGYVQPLILVTGTSADQMRLDQLRGKANLDGYLIRSPSSMNDKLPASGRLRFAVIAPEYYEVNNSNIPFGANDGAVWAGRGKSTRILTGFRLEAGPLSIIAAPEFLDFQNKYWLLRHGQILRASNHSRATGRGIRFSLLHRTVLDRSSTADGAQADSSPRCWTIDGDAHAARRFLRNLE